ncbi:MAG: transcriptional activator NhaR [Gammaproteobacteria bacterium]
MRHLNYKHLYYFWVIASEGGISRAAERLFLTPQTLSGQLARLEESVGEKLFKRSGRRMVLSDTGEIVFRYADEMFRIGAELTDVVRGRLPAGAGELRVGISDVVPKLVAYRVLEPVLKLDPPVRLSCRDGKLEELLVELSRHRLDLVLSDSVAPNAAAMRVFSHRLGRSAVGMFAAGALALRYKRDFPNCLDGAPMLLPGRTTAVRRAIDRWVERCGIAPLVKGEFEDSALLKTFGAAGVGVFAASTIIEPQVVAQYGARALGRAEGVAEEYYAITVERRIRHPAIAAITAQARELLDDS